MSIFMLKYDFGKIEKKWQKYWREKKIYEPDLKSAKRPFYNLMMFPYPSAEGLHVGNMYAFTGADIYGRMKRMQCYDVFQPIGLDGFGIHSENYALKIKAHPMEQAKVSEKRFYEQLQVIGNGFAWDEKLETYDPEYYKWTQWIFVQLFKRGLAYRAKAPVNWCPSCKTVLADEQVITGRCERCGTLVERKELEQWFFRITKYAEKLLENLEKIDWSERVKIAQRNWIGKSEGASIKFSISSSQFSIKEIEVFTTRPDTLYGATFMVISPELAKEWVDAGWEAPEEVKKHVAEALRNRGEEQKEKTGVFSGISAINPATKKEIPVWVSDYVLAGYGTGAIMAVPAHDERDWEFAKKYKLPIVEVVEPLFVKTDDIDGVRPGLLLKERDAVVAVVKHWAEDKYLCLKWKKTDWRGFIVGGIEKGEDMAEAAAREIREETGYKSAKFVRDLGGIVHALFYHAVKNENRWARFHGLYFELADGKREEIADEENQIHDVVWVDKKEVDRFLDWVTDMRLIWHRASNPDDFPGRSALHESSRVSEQGILTRSGKFDGMSAEEAKWKITDFVDGKRESHYRLRDWLVSRQRYWGPPIPMIHCDKCSWQPVPEEDLPVILPKIKDFQPKGKGESPLASDKSFYETKCPKCSGRARRETDVSDTFLDSAWYYLRYPSVKEKNAPWNKETTKKWLPVNLYTGGAEHSVLHLLYVRFLALALHDEKLLEFGKSPAPHGEPFPKFRAHGLLIKEGAKMSKSKGNVVNPDEYIKRFGADTLRMYLMFIAPFEQGGDFRDSSILGVARFLERVWKVGVAMENPPGEDPDPALTRILSQMIKKVTEDIEDLHYNTAVSALMIALNDIEARTPVNFYHQTLARADWESFLKLLAPFAPHITEELWEKLGNKNSIHKEKWPEYDLKLIREETFDLIVEINGKHRATISVSRGTSEKEASNVALNEEKIKSLLAGVKIKKTIFVKDRLINFVV